MNSSFAKPILCSLLLPPLLAHAATTIDATNTSAYGANIGWVNTRGDVANGAVVGEFTCAGFIYSANSGWINLGSGSPTNHIQYSNSSATDFGVNVTNYAFNAGNPEAQLRGFAYGANIGWVNFEATGNPRVNLATGRLQGYAWGANVGWIALSETGVTVTTTSIQAGVDSDGDSIPDNWEFFYASGLGTMNATSDSDQDGLLDKEEYAADTNPFNNFDILRLISLVPPRTVLGTGVFATDVAWVSKPSRWYQIEANADLLSSWLTVADLLVPDAGSTTFKRFNDPFLTTNPLRRFYRVRAGLPLAP